MNSELKIFTPYKIGNLKVKNRVVRSATYMGASKENGEVTEKLTSKFVELAKNEVGLIISGYMYVTKNGKSAPRQSGIYDDSLVKGLKKMVSQVKEYSDVIFFAQIAHGGRQVVTGKQFVNLDITDVPSLAPSSIADKLLQIKPKEMTIEEIKNCEKSFIDAARRVYEAGFDGVQLHCAHGYLLSTFLSPYSNIRKDDYGGSIENRFRIIKKIVLGIQDEVGKDFPIIVKLNVADFVGPNETQLRVDESKQYAKMMTDLGICAIETSGGIYETVMYGNLSTSRVKIKNPEDEAYFLNEAKIIKEEVGDCPVILVGGIRSLEVAEKVLNEGIDFISLSRPLIREPDLLIKWRNGTSTKADCISCNRCLLDLSPKGVRCIVLEKLEKKRKRQGKMAKK